MCIGGVFMSVRVNITLEDEVLKRIDERAKSMGISRSAFIAVSSTAFMDQQDAIRFVRGFPSNFGGEVKRNDESKA